MTSKELLQVYALSMLGTHYRWGGDDPMSGYDCSGLVVELLVAMGMLPPGIDLTAQGLADKYKGCPSTRDLGALAFYGRSMNEVSHVGMLLNSVHMIEAGGGDRHTTDKDAAAEKNAFVRVRPIAVRRDFCGILMPRYPWN
jgi:cell wall-associated NlpC family hydrolase